MAKPIWGLWVGRRSHHPRPLHYFRVRPSRRSRLFVHVEVYRTVGDLRRASDCDSRLAGKRFNARGMVGQCVAIEERRKRDHRLLGGFAIVRLAARYCGTTTITHEAFHATCRWAARKRLTLDLSCSMTRAMIARPEERMATAHDALCRGIVHRLYRLGVLK